MTESASTTGLLKVVFSPLQSTAVQSKNVFVLVVVLVGVAILVSGINTAVIVLK